MQVRLCAATLIVFALLAQPAFAATTTTSFTVSTDVIASCSVSATDLAFGNYDSTTGADLDASNTISVTCTNGTSYDIGLDAGAGLGATVTGRKMTQGTDTLNYALYSDSSRTTNWGNTVGVDTMSGTGTGSAVSHTVYGRVPGSQTSPVGSYSDTITVTVTY